MLELIARRAPDLVVISGDLTQRAKPGQFREARAFVDRIAVPTLTVPGNHDVPMYRIWERVLAPYGAYRRYFARDLEPIFEDRELLVVGVNTAFNWTTKHGRIEHRRLREVEHRLAAAPAGVTRIVVAHHELIPAPRWGSRKVLRNARRSVEVFARAGVELVLSGHLHQAWVGNSESYYPSGRPPVLLLHAGTTTSARGRGIERRRNSCNWVVVDDRGFEITHLGWHATEERFVAWSRHLYPRRERRPYGLETF